MFASQHTLPVSYGVPQHISRINGQPPRTLYQFRRPQEVLRAVRDAIAAHKNYYRSTGMIHGGVTVESLSIGAPPNAPHAHGFLVQRTPITDDPTFQSVTSLSRILHRRPMFPIDYLDDLESFYYVLVWMCYSYNGVVGGLPYLVPMERRARVLVSWAAAPTSRESVLEKEAMLFGSGIVFNDYPVSDYWGGENFEELLDNLHFVISSRYKEKTELGRARTIEELRSDAQQDYGSVLRSINEALFRWERQG